MSKNVLILGGSSSIARAAAYSFAKNGYSLFLAGRDLVDLERIAQDIKIRHQVEVKCGFFAAEDYDDHSSFLQTVVREMGSLQGVLAAFGYYKDHKKAMTDFTYALKIIEVNYTGVCSILTHCSNYLALQGDGFIMAISSVAGDRGRQSNYIYGSAKAGLNVFLQGLRNRLYHAGVRVITIKPGFVDTAMTYQMPGMFLVATPQKVGDKIVKALDHSSDVVYLPGFWRYIMGVVCLIPEFMFKRLKL